MKKFGIHFRLLLAAFFLIGATTFTLDLVVIHITTTFMHKRFKDRILFLAKYLALNSEVGVLIGDKVGLQSLAMNLLGEEDVTSVVVMDKDGEHLVSLARETNHAISMVETPIKLKKSGDENLLFTQRMTPFGHIHLSGEEIIGHVRIYFSTHNIDQLLIDITKKFFWFSSGLVCLAGILFYFISHSIVFDVTKLAATARHVGSGNLSLRAQPGRLPETRELALAFNAMLDSLVKSRDALERANKKVIQQKALAEVGKFSLMVAHEVKNPIGIIKSSIDILKKDLDLSSNDMLINYIEEEIRRLNRLIEDFLMFARPAKPSFKQKDLNNLIRDVLERFYVQYHSDSGIRILSDISLAKGDSHVDSDLFIRCFDNILKNAIEANDGAGAVCVTSKIIDQTWVAEVSDEGEGVAPENYQKIFEPFFTTRSKGTGLGLAFASQVISAHGGSIVAKNGKEKGAVFKVEIPLNGKV